MNTQLQLDFDKVYDSVLVAVDSLIADYEGEFLNQVKTLKSENPQGVVEVSMSIDLWIEMYTARLRINLPDFDRTQLNILSPDSAFIQIFQNNERYLGISIVRNTQSRNVRIEITKTV